jgi:AraC-like DNA-binding protein
MLEILIPTLVGLLSFVAILLGKTLKRNRVVFNNYFIAILIIVGAIRVIPFLNYIIYRNELAYNRLLVLSAVSSLILIPLVYLYIQSLLAEKRVKGYYHMIIPVITATTIVTLKLKSTLYFRLFLAVYYGAYLVASFLMASKFFGNQPFNLIKSAFKNRIRNWLFILLAVYSYTFIILLLSIFGFKFFNEDFKFIESYFLSSVGWLFVLIFLITNKNLILNTLPVKYNKEDLLNFWSLKALQKIDEKDRNYHRLDPEEMINKLMDLESNFTLISSHNLNLKFISERLNIPVYQLKLLFKYHNSLSVVEYQNVLRIMNAINHIKRGYLNSFTVESLSKKIGFNSRITFYKNFKKYVGISVSQYKNTLS